MLSKRNQKKIVSSANKSAKHAVQSAGTKAARFTDNITDMANEAGHTAREFIDNAAANLNDAKENVVERIQDKPIQSSLIALGAGFVLGVLFRR